jgi:ribonuclease HI
VIDRWTLALPENTSAQKTELIAHTKALKLRKRKRLNIYTDSRYAFATAHVHEAIYQQRSLLTSGGKGIKNKEVVLALLKPSMTLPR